MCNSQSNTVWLSQHTSNVMLFMCVPYAINWCAVPVPAHSVQRTLLAACVIFRHANSQPTDSHSYAVVWPNNDTRQRAHPREHRRCSIKFDYFVQSHKLNEFKYVWVWSKVSGTASATQMKCRKEEKEEEAEESRTRMNVAD